MTALLTPSPSLLTTERGGPVPPSDVMAALHRLDPALGLRFMPDFDRSRWALTWEWPASDARWARVQSSEIPRDAAYDIIGYLPVGCTLDEARGYVESHLKFYPREAVSRIRNDMTRWNEVEIPRQQVQTLMADTMDDVARAERAPKGQLISLPTSGRVKRRKA